MTCHCSEIFPLIIGQVALLATLYYFISISSLFLFPSLFYTLEQRVYCRKKRGLLIWQPLDLKV